ncbi:tetratricopeptide repeat-containing sulfotransferase family protein [Thermomonas sp.]|uniref:tetratricopeptide repeat-containing sulfotransferase family protein n=1 Tax=Thermomonas sp. TaxID=1971895 RepID=UPI0026313B5B|nr:tetratricopeptide repeat-containing sulfotransferase family protein [Thermomonas sp.]
MSGDPRMAGLASGVAESLQAGARALRDGRLMQAEALFKQACQRAPTHPEPLRYLAIVELQTRRAERAVATLDRALALAPEDALLHADLGTARAASGDLASALVSWRRACSLAPDQPIPWFNLGRNLQQIGDTEGAIDALERAATLAPALLPARVLLGDALAHAGRFDAAARSYREALRLRPACGDAWRGLSNIKTKPLDEADIQTLRVQLLGPDVAPPDRVAMGHALGKAEEDRGQLDAALAAFTAANALQEQLTPWRPEAFESFVAQSLVATGSLPAPIDPTLGREVIFIVGLPRSGSTLFEQILAAHPEVEGASELDDLGIVIQRESMRRKRPYPQWVPQATAADWQQLGQDYLARTARWRARRPRMTDKQPDNWKHAGILRAMLPGATVIETRRDPRETAWSCFKQQFYSQPHFANTLAHIALYLRRSEQAMDTHRSRDPGHIHLHRYEDLLDAPEAHIRALLDDCGLAFDPACLSPHRSARSVRTASAAQVRQPLRAAATHALAYGALLDPLWSLLKLPLSML